VVIRLIVGLGNPGPQYDATRHNAGFWFVDEVARKLSLTLVPERSYFGMAGRASAGAQPLWLLEPTTFMNVSGKSVAALARFFKIEPAEILVAHDELDLLPGQAKMKLGGSHAGHNGLKDIQAQLGSADFWRLRIGIGHPGDKNAVADFVLHRPSQLEETLMRDALDQSLSALPLMVAGDMAAAMHQLHTKEKPVNGDR
jgi:PTH1 family peptidyl-tRNA hydrolase